MSMLSDFSYAQARLQARHGQRPGDRTWRTLRGIRDLSHFLQTARTTPLRPWLLHIGAHTQEHDLELSLRRQFRAYVNEVAQWQPKRWCRAVTWIRYLVDLPTIQHLILGEPAPVWVLEDDALRAFASEELALRIDGLKDSEWAPLVRDWQSGLPLPQCWLRRWRALWPSASAAQSEPLEALIALVESQVAVLSGRINHSQAARDLLSRELHGVFRRHTHQPAAAVAHLGLVALDLERLRGEVVRRMLFTVPTGMSA